MRHTFIATRRNLVFSNDFTSLRGRTFGTFACRIWSRKRGLANLDVKEHTTHFLKCGFTLQCISALNLDWFG
jgi:hypothetical protein